MILKSIMICRSGIGIVINKLYKQIIPCIFKVNQMSVCAKCKSELKKGNILNSGNTIFQEWICPKCNTKSMKAVGVNK